jgi:hypothetical protein
VLKNYNVFCASMKNEIPREKFTTLIVLIICDDCPNLILFPKVMAVTMFSFASQESNTYLTSMEHNDSIEFARFGKYLC